jgi:endonuclease YncB( thermonuclease family)
LYPIPDATKKPRRLERLAGQLQGPRSIRRPGPFERVCDYEIREEISCVLDICRFHRASFIRMQRTLDQWKQRLWLLIALVLVVNAAWADVIVGHVIRITDGDTLVIVDPKNLQYKIRLAGIDSPERNQAFGNAAKQSLSFLAFGKPALVEFQKRDRYGRIVGKVFVGNLDVCLEQIRLGMAWHYKDYELEQSVEDRIAYAIEEVRARRNRVGLWKDREQSPPGEWRHPRALGR